MTEEVKQKIFDYLFTTKSTTSLHRTQIKDFTLFWFVAGLLFPFFVFCGGVPVGSEKKMVL